MISTKANQYFLCQWMCMLYYCMIVCTRLWSLNEISWILKCWLFFDETHIKLRWIISLPVWVYTLAARKWWTFCRWHKNAFSTKKIRVFWFNFHWSMSLTHWGRVTYIGVGNLTIIGSDNGLSPDRRQAIAWTNAELLLIAPLVTNSEFSFKMTTFLFKKMHLKTSSAKRRSFCIGLNVLRAPLTVHHHCFRGNGLVPNLCWSNCM